MKEVRPGGGGRTSCLVPFNSKKYKLIYSDRKQTSGGRGKVKRREEEITEGQEETSGDDGYVPYLDRGDGCTGAYVCQNLLKVHFKYV